MQLTVKATYSIFCIQTIFYLLIMALLYMCLKNIAMQSSTNIEKLKFNGI